MIEFFFYFIYKLKKKYKNIFFFFFTYKFFFDSFIFFFFFLICIIAILFRKIVFLLEGTSFRSRVQCVVQKAVLKRTETMHLTENDAFFRSCNNERQGKTFFR